MSARKDVPHGNVTRYRRGCHCPSCTRAAARYEQERMLDVLAGTPRRIPILGSQRRLRALVALGYDWKTLGRELGVTDTMVTQWATERQYMFRSTAERVAEVYDRLSMVLPPTETAGQKNAVSRARNRASRLGWVPPLGWDEGALDDPDARPAVRSAERPGHNREDDVDHAMVERVLAGQSRDRKLTRAEAHEITTRLLRRGHSTTEIEARWGLKADRYVRLSEAAS